MKQFIDEMRETASMLMGIFMAGLVVFAFILPCFLD